VLTLISVFIALHTSLHYKASYIGLCTFIIYRVPDNYPSTHIWVARLS